MKPTEIEIYLDSDVIPLCRAMMAAEKVWEKSMRKLPGYDSHLTRYLPVARTVPGYAEWSDAVNAWWNACDRKRNQQED